jgi:hypothetical protein
LAPDCLKRSNILDCSLLTARPINELFSKGYILFERNISPLSELNQLIWHIHALADKSVKNSREKVFALWSRLLAIIDLQSKEGKALASTLCGWAIFVDKIDSTTREWLLKIAPFAGESHGSYELIKNLSRLSESQPYEVQEIWLEMVKQCPFDYPEDAIRKMLSNLVAAGETGQRKSREVVDAYLERGVERPRIWLHEIMG